MFLEGDKVKVDDAGVYHMATVVRDDGNRVWVTLDKYIMPNPVWFRSDDLEPA